MRLKSWPYLAGAVFWLFAGTASAFETGSEPVKKKLKELEQIQEARKTAADLGAYQNPSKRTPTLRDSGREESILFAHEMNFRFVGDIGFYVKNLIVSLQPNDPSSPVIFDDPLSFSIQPIKGSVLLTPTSLNALFNEHVFNFPGATVKDLSITTEPGFLTLAGKMMRTKWVPFKMKGRLKLEDGHMLYYTPDQVIVDGVDATKVLVVANAKLDELLKVKAVGAELIGSTMHLDASLLFPPPKLKLNIKEARLESGGLALEFDSDKAPTFPEPIVPSNSYMMVKSGDVKFLRAMPIDAGLQIISLETDKGLDFCLYDYRKQIARGYLNLTPDGRILAHMLNFTSLTQARVAQ